MSSPPPDGTKNTPIEIRVQLVQLSEPIALPPSRSISAQGRGLLVPTPGALSWSRHGMECPNSKDHPQSGTVDHWAEKRRFGVVWGLFHVGRDSITFQRGFGYRNTPRPCKPLPHPQFSHVPSVLRTGRSWRIMVVLHLFLQKACLNSSACARLPSARLPNSRQKKRLSPCNNMCPCENKATEWPPNSAPPNCRRRRQFSPQSPHCRLAIPSFQSGRFTK